MGDYDASADLGRTTYERRPLGGLVRSMDAAIQVPDTASNGETIDFLRLPQGAMLIDLFMAYDAFGTSCTLDVGLAAVTGGSTAQVGVDVLVDGADVAAAGVLRRSEVGIFSRADLLLDSDYLLRGTIGGADVGATPVDIEVHVLYRQTEDE